VLLSAARRECEGNTRLTYKAIAYRKTIKQKKEKEKHSEKRTRGTCCTAPDTLTRKNKSVEKQKSAMGIPLFFIILDTLRLSTSWRNDTGWCGQTTLAAPFSSSSYVTLHDARTANEAFSLWGSCASSSNCTVAAVKLHVFLVLKVTLFSRALSLTCYFQWQLVVSSYSRKRPD
jgi:hypothetical protein